MRPFKRIRRKIRRRLRQVNFKPIIVVTGCSSGLGLALAKKLYTIKRYRVVVTARNASLEILKKEFRESDRFMIQELDVTQESSRTHLIEHIKAEWGAVNVLVNNAGVTFRAVVEHMTEADDVLQMATNYHGPMGLIRLVLPGMRQLGRGKIICVSSVSGMLAMPTMSAYSASKHALEGGCEALWYEAKPYGIDVSLIQPGFIRSDSFQNTRFTEHSDPKLNANSPYREYYRNMGPFIAQLMGRSPTTPDDVADKILKVIQTENPPLWVPATWDAVIFYYIRRLLPRRFLLPILFRCLPGSRHWATTHTNKRRR